MSTTHYVDKIEFHNELVIRYHQVNEILISLNFIDADKLHLLDHEQRKVLVKKAKLGNHIPKPSNNLGEIFLKMTENISYMKCFNRYPFKDEMIGDSVIDCIKYIDTFDITRDNPFAYFTQAIKQAFIRRILREKKEGYVKSRLLSKADLDVFKLQEHDEDGEFANSFIEYMNVYNNFDGSYFEKKPKEVKATKYNGSTLEEFINEENNELAKTEISAGIQ